ncbi:MAG TPA: hypothetical protein PK369_04020 [Thermoclostridium sp.]|nr:hypothetical protein [Thermoclostridium sp.]
MGKSRPMESLYFMLFSLSNRDLPLLLALDEFPDVFFVVSVRDALVAALRWDEFLEKTLRFKDRKKPLILLKAPLRP